MRKYVFIKKTKRHIITTLFLTITTLMLLSFLPYITETNTVDDSPDRYHNFETMKKSDNIILNDLASYLDWVIIISWVTTAIGFISFIGLSIDLIEKYRFIGKTIVFTGCSMVVLTVLSFILFYLFTNHVNETIGISLSNLFGPFKYSYITLIFIIFSMFSSGAYLAYVSFYYYTSEKAGAKKNKKEKNKKKVKEPKKQRIKSDKKEPLQSKDKTDLSLKKQVTDLDKKSKEMENWLVSEAKKSNEFNTDTEKDEEKTSVTEEVEPDLKNEISTQSKEEEKATKSEGKSPFKDEPEKTIFSESSKKDASPEPQTHESFQQALSSAIEKKHKSEKPEELDIKKEDDTSAEKVKSTETKKKPQKEEPKVEEQAKKETSVVKKFNVRCPGCKHVFIVEKKIDGVTNIKCPKCGKEGVIK